MNGAREYSKLFKTGQHGRLYLVSSSHARGRTFRIFVLPQDEDAAPNGESNPPLNKDAVEVYGVVSGNPGWTESYGWLHNGPWQEDFARMVERRKSEIERQREIQEQEQRDVEQEESERAKHVLQTYQSETA